MSKKGHVQKLMFSYFLKETAYGAGVTMNDTNACSVIGHDGSEPDYKADVFPDKDTVSEYEHGTDIDINNYSLAFPYKEPRARPIAIAGHAALNLGSITSEQDSTFQAYRHKIVEVAAGTALPSMQGEYLKGGEQWACYGLMSNIFKLSGQKGGYIVLEDSMLGSGKRATAATAFASKLTNPVLSMSGAKVWIETGSNITISTTPAQGTQSISGATPDDFHPRLESFEFGHENDLAGEGLHDANGYLVGMDYGRRKFTFKISAMFKDSTERGYFENKAACAIEIDKTTSVLIDASGTYKYGLKLIIPQAKIINMPDPKGGVNDRLLQDLEFDIENDGTNPPAILYVYNAAAAYFA